MERSCGSSRKHRGDNECGEFQHGDHDGPPDLRFGEWHGHGQSQWIDNKRLIGEEDLRACGDKHTPVSRRTRDTGAYSGVLGYL